MSNTFFVYVPSNIKDYPDNRPNKFRMHLPKPLYFSGNWVCGLHSISYPYSWPSTIGTLDDQAIFIHYTDDNGKDWIIKVPIQKASHTSEEKLRDSLNATLKFQSKVVGLLSEKSFIDEPSAERGSRKRRHTGSSDEEQKKRERQQLQDSVNLFFNSNPDDYWDYINDEKSQLGELNNELREKVAEYERIPESSRDEKRKLWQAMKDISVKKRYKEQKIAMLETEAKRRDDESEERRQRLSQEFLKMYPTNYWEKLNEERLKLATWLSDFQAKLQTYSLMKDPVELQILAQEIVDLRRSIKHQRTNLNFISDGILQREKQKTNEQYEQDNWMKHASFVNEFFTQHPDSYWTAIQVKLNHLQVLYRELREKKELLQFETQESERIRLQDDIRGKENLVIYRRERFSALEYEAKRRDAIDAKWAKFKLVGEIAFSNILGDVFQPEAQALQEEDPVDLMFGKLPGPGEKTRGDQFREKFGPSQDVPTQPQNKPPQIVPAQPQNESTVQSQDKPSDQQSQSKQQAPIEQQGTLQSNQQAPVKQQEKIQSNQQAPIEQQETLHAASKEVQQEDPVDSTFGKLPGPGEKSRGQQLAESVSGESGNHKPPIPTDAQFNMCIQQHQMSHWKTLLMPYLEDCQGKEKPIVHNCFSIPCLAWVLI